MIPFFTIILNALMLVAAPQWKEVRSLPMSKPNHPLRWYEQMMEVWPDQQEHLIQGTRADGTPKATPDGLIWKDLSVTSTEVMPFCHLGNRLYMIGFPGLRSYHLQVDTTQYEVKANVPLDLGRLSILVFDEKVARIAFPIHGRMVYGHRIGELYTDDDGNIWEEVWRNAKSIHEEKETHHREHNQSKTNRNDSYLLTCSLGTVNAIMEHEAKTAGSSSQAKVSGSQRREDKRVAKANERKEKKARKEAEEEGLGPQDPRERWDFKVNILPYVPKEDDVEQYHYRYIEIRFKGSNIQVVANEEVVAESSEDSSPLYVPVNVLENKELQLYITPKENGEIDMSGIRLVECVHELVQ